MSANHLPRKQRLTITGDSVFGPGLGETQRTILELLRRGGQSTLADLEASLTLATETLRDHLKTLAAKGLVERAGVRREGPGRPFVLYRLTASGTDLFPRREGEILRELTNFLVASGREQLLAEFFATRTERRKVLLLDRVAGLDGKERLDEVAQILSEDGFLAEVQDSEHGPRLRLCHCPLQDLVAASHLPCKAEMSLVSGLLGETLHRESFMPDGHSSCTYAVGAGVDASNELEPPPNSTSRP